jgi:hypothetical protein
VHTSLSSPQLKPAASTDIYHDIETMDEGIDQERIITDPDYQSVDAVLEDDVREKRMKLLHKPEQPVTLTKDVLIQQFTDKQSKYIIPELVKRMKEIIIRKINKKRLIRIN